MSSVRQFFSCPLASCNQFCICNTVMKDYVYFSRHRSLFSCHWPNYQFCIYNTYEALRILLHSFKNPIRQINKLFLFLNQLQSVLHLYHCYEIRQLNEQKWSGYFTEDVAKLHKCVQTFKLTDKPFRALVLHYKRCT